MPTSNKANLAYLSYIQTIAARESFYREGHRTKLAEVTGLPGMQMSMERHKKKKQERLRCLTRNMSILLPGHREEKVMGCLKKNSKEELRRSPVSYRKTQTRHGITTTACDLAG